MSAVKTGYLFLYNLASFSTWAYIWYLTVSSVYLNGLDKTASSLWSIVEFPLIIAQSSAILECLHSLVGLVRAPFLTTLIQVFSRVFILWCINYISVDSRQQIGFVFMILAWATSELPRYSFYACGLLMEKEKIPYFLIWLRYTLFIVLYPTGVSGELSCIWNSIPYFTSHPLIKLTMPNSYNFSFDWVSFLYFAIALYPPGFYFLYTYMIVQRKKVLGGGEKEKKDGKTRESKKRQ